MVKNLLAILAGLVITLSVALAAMLNWSLPAMPRPGATGDFLVRNVSMVDVLNGRTLPERNAVVRAGVLIPLAQAPWKEG